MERFIALYETVYKDLYYLALYYTGNSQDAEDVVSETVLKAYEKFSDLRKEEAFRSWIIRILINQCKRQYRIGKIHKSETFVTEPSYVPALEDKLVTKEMMRILSREERMIVGLFVFCGYKGEEIAELMSLNHSTVRSKYRRAMDKLRKQILAEEVHYEI